jgi:predicted nucleotidyltransferase
MKNLVVNISNVFKEEDIQFILIGALARDLYFDAKGLELDIRTKDVDFAI